MRSTLLVLLSLATPIYGSVLADENRLNPDVSAVQKSHPSSGKRTIKYRSFGNIQVYSTLDEIWVFVDVDVVADRTADTGSVGLLPNSRSISCSQVEHRVFVINNKGLVHSWRFPGTAISAHPNFTTFFRKSGETLAYVHQTMELHRLRMLDNQATFALVGDPLVHKEILGVAQNRRISEDAILRIGKTNGFVKEGDGQYGWGKFPATDFVSRRLGVRIRFEDIKGKLGWRGAIAESLSKPPAWKTVLLSLDPPKPIAAKPERKIKD